MSDIGVNYENFWGNPEQRPPGSVTVEQGENRERIPYSVEIDQAKLEKFLQQEGVEKGRAMKVKLFYPRDTVIGKIFRGGNRDRGENNESEPRYWSARAVRAKGNMGIVEINAGAIYELALALPYKDQESLGNRIQVMTAFVLGHELQHLRQTGAEGEYHELQITRHKGIIGFAEKMKQEVKSMLTPREIEANKLGWWNRGLLADAVKVDVRDQEMLERDDFWGKAARMVRETKDIVAGGFNQK